MFLFWWVPTKWYIDPVLIYDAGPTLNIYDGYVPSIVLGTRILVQVTIYHRLLIGQDGHLDQSEAYDIS